MSRTLGFFLGSAAVFAMLVYFLGQPVSLAPPPRDTGSAAKDRLASSEWPAAAAPVAGPPAPYSVNPAVGAPAGSAIFAGPPEPAPVPGLSPNLPAEPVEGIPPSDTGLPADDVPPATEGVLPGGMAPPPATPDADQLVVDGQSWFPVWDPFQSELSANAFARRLERVTGLDYRVIKSGPAQYRVAVAYATEDDRIANVATIEEATGLSIAGGSR